MYTLNDCQTAAQTAMLPCLQHLQKALAIIEHLPSLQDPPNSIWWAAQDPTWGSDDAHNLVLQTGYEALYQSLRPAIAIKALLEGDNAKLAAFKDGQGNFADMRAALLAFFPLDVDPSL